VAILSFALTTEEFLSGNKTVTRRSWSDSHLKMWQRLWEANRLVHDAWDNSPRAGGKRIGRFELTRKPYRERLADMPPSDLEAEGGMCSSLEEFCEMIRRSPNDYVSVVRFRKL